MSSAHLYSYSVRPSYIITPYMDIDCFQRFKNIKFPFLVIALQLATK